MQTPRMLGRAMCFGIGVAVLNSLSACGGRVADLAEATPSEASLADTDGSPGFGPRDGALDSTLPSDDASVVDATGAGDSGFRDGADVDLDAGSPPSASCAVSGPCDAGGLWTCEGGPNDPSCTYVCTCPNGTVFCNLGCP